VSSQRVVVSGAGGFIGGHLVQRLLAEGRTDVTAVDIKPPADWFQRDPRADNVSADLQDLEACRRIVCGASIVYNLAADMGGMGFIENNKALCMLSVLINTHLLIAARDAGVQRYFYSSSACVYRASRQAVPGVAALAEDDAYPAMPEDGYGWEKLFSERMCRHFWEDFGLETRVGRYHNVYGPHGTYDGGREKAPAAICRKVIRAKLSGDKRIVVWGDGSQTRSFTYISDCVEGTRRLMESEVRMPLNIGSSEMVSIDQLVDLVEEIAGVRLIREYDTGAPKGVAGRNSDNTQIRQRLGWEPSTPLLVGLETTYRWIYDQLSARV
jgi:GDP-D-mannose 3',5'-epimerase